MTARAFALLAVITGTALPVVSAPPLRPVDAVVVEPSASTRSQTGPGPTSLLIACESAGRVLQIDPNTGRLAGFVETGGRLVAIENLPSGRAAVIDRAGHRLIVLSTGPAGPRIDAELEVVKDPTSLEPIDHERVCIAGLWSKRVECRSVDPASAESERHWITSLPFSPGVMRFLKHENTLLVADAFGSQLAYLDADSGKCVRQISFFGHRLRGFVDDPDGERIVVAHQMLNSSAQATSNDIHWGNMVSNDLRWLSRRRIMDDDDSLFYKDGHIDPIGVVSQGGSDPNDLVITEEGIVIAALGGMNRVAVGEESDAEYDRLPTGINPVALCVSEDGQTAWVVNRLDDSLTKIDIQRRRVSGTIQLNPDLTLTDADRGERLFHHGRLSHDGWMTCASCHPAGHAVNDRIDNLSDGDYTSPKRVLSLLGRASTAPFGWTGSAKTLESQLRRSVRGTMNGSRELTDAQVLLLTAFLKTLPSPPSEVSLCGSSTGPAIQRGAKIFEGRNCGDCHTPDRFTSPNVYDVGIEDEIGNTHFNPPSLIGVGQRGPRYLHDLRAASLEAVFTEHKHQIDDPITSQQLSDLLTYLESL